MARYIIRRIRLAHCKRGPAVCEKCREMDSPKICLLDICPPHPGEMQRRVIEVKEGSESTWHEFDVVRIFGSEGEAREFAEKEGVENVEM